MDRTHHTALSPLSDLEDYEFAEGSPDIRGWVVIDETGREIGEVEDLLVDTTSHEALYAVVDLDDGEDAEVPLALVTLDIETEAIRLTPSQAGDAPEDLMRFGAERREVARNLEDLDRDPIEDPGEARAREAETPDRKTGRRDKS